MVITLIKPADLLKNCALGIAGISKNFEYPETLILDHHKIGKCAAGIDSNSHDYKYFLKWNKSGKIIYP